MFCWEYFLDDFKLSNYSNYYYPTLSNIINAIR